MKARVLTALALIPPVLGAIFYSSSWPLVGLLSIVALIGLWEIHRLTKQLAAVIGAIFVLGIAAAILYWPPGRHSVDTLDLKRLFAIAGGTTFLLGVASLLLFPPKSQKTQPASIFYSGWLLGPLLSILALHLGPFPAETWKFASPVLMAIVPLWAGDTAAIFAGKAFGKHKLAPNISPKKTVEGGVANLLACMLAAWGLGVWLKIPLAQSLACGAAAGIFGQMGDLFESWLKRRVDLKDSGTLLPGHGGILDRIDSILFTAPVVALILLYSW